MVRAGGAWCLIIPFKDMPSTVSWSFLSSSLLKVPSLQSVTISGEHCHIQTIEVSLVLLPSFWFIKQFSSMIVSTITVLFWGHFAFSLTYSSVCPMQDFPPSLRVFVVCWSHSSYAVACWLVIWRLPNLSVSPSNQACPHRSQSRSCQKRSPGSLEWESRAWAEMRASVQKGSTQFEKMLALIALCLWTPRDSALLPDVLLPQFPPGSLFIPKIHTRFYKIIDIKQTLQ